MAQQNDSGFMTFEAATALLARRLVRLSSGVTVGYNGASNTDYVGVTQDAASAAGDYVALKLNTAPGTAKVEAAGSFSAGATLYAAADGKVDDSGTVVVGEALEAASGSGSIIEMKFAINPAATATREVVLAPQDARVHDALQTSLPTTAANDDLGLIPGTFGTSAPLLQSVDYGGTTTTAYARWLVQIPDDYNDGDTLTLRILGGALTTVSDTTLTVDANVYADAGDGTVGSDLCATAAQSINSLTAANKDFTITPTGLVAGQMLDIRIAVAGDDSGDAGVMKANILKTSLVYTANT
jgi:hypothetical protein